MVYEDIAEACQTARLLLFEQLTLVDAPAKDELCVVVTVDEIHEHWWRISQRPAHKGELERSAVVASQHIALCRHGAAEWELLGRLGVERLGGELERWPATRQRAAHVCARLVLPAALAHQLNLRIAWEYNTP